MMYNNDFTTPMMILSWYDNYYDSTTNTELLFINAHYTTSKLSQIVNSQ